MKLINTSTEVLEEFVGLDIPEYAILSHTWEEEEVTFKDFTTGSCKGMKGYRKIEATCRLARESGLHYAWVDTCCIDKSSSAELTECINSMYRWYARSTICYVYLSDLPAATSLEAGLSCCRWFTRGWTLQELIAPRDIDFYDQEWHRRGEKSLLLRDLSSITGIRESVLCHEEPLSAISVAERMSWASTRQTTRVEDISYCLLGIFGVYMPMLYGEAENAFRRLQEEIIKSIPDVSILAWRRPRTDGPQTRTGERIYSSVLAASPSAFRRLDSVHHRPATLFKEFRTSNQGIMVQSRVVLEQMRPLKAFRYILPLYESDDNFEYGIRLRKLDTGKLVREDPFDLAKIDWGFSHLSVLKSLCLLTELPPYTSTSVWLVNLVRHNVLQIQLPKELKFRDIRPWSKWDDESQIFFAPQRAEFGCASAGIDGLLSQWVGKKGVVSAPVTCVFYAVVGWSLEGGEPLQCTVIDRRRFDTAVNDLNARVEEDDQSLVELLQHLDYYQIPRQSAVCFDTSREGMRAVVSFRTERVIDHTICRGPLWRVVFSWKFCKARDAPVEEGKKWSGRIQFD
ncbi:HET-domain-containing protein [Podospora aff. communis PSN243]|uniref:HET-domain-containing protein n=1 Tax=Podospora aff. communis PSN243 TaxID=3040156 RepID=A0AAV9G881_9PEZI|nr:HET-domain-containing protein [Podospora aff. communis PSN243]